MGTPRLIKDAGHGKLHVSAGDKSVTVDKVLVAIGRKPNFDNLDLDKAGLMLNADGTLDHDPNTLQVGRQAVYSLPAMSTPTASCYTRPPTKAASRVSMLSADKRGRFSPQDAPDDYLF